MKRDHFSLIREPRGKLYRDILDYATRVCREALLVVGETIPLAASGNRVIEKLEPFLIERGMRSEWPGTKLLCDKAQVFRYSLNSECARILKESSSGLYDWCQPSLPEDLSFSRTHGDPWLVSIAHEKDAYFCLSDHEKALLLQAIPDLSRFVKKDEF